MITDEQDKLFYRSYLDTLLWSSSDNEISDNRDEVVLSPVLQAKGKLDCHKFLLKAQHLIESYPQNNYAQAGYDFALTRNHHGAGFFDGDWGDELGEKLTEICDAFGDVEIYLGDDGLLYS